MKTQYEKLSCGFILQIDCGQLDGKQFSKENGFAGYFETSAKTGVGIKEAVHFVVKRVSIMNTLASKNVDSHIAFCVNNQNRGISASQILMSLHRNVIFPYLYVLELLPCSLSLLSVVLQHHTGFTAHT